MIWLAKHFQIVPLAEIETMVLERRKPKKPYCAITFDDGYRNNFENAWPILKELGLSATIFITTGFLDEKRPLWVDHLEYAINMSRTQSFALSWPEGEKKYSIGTTAEKIAADAEIRERLKKISDFGRNQLLDELVNQTGARLSTVLDNQPDYAPLSWDQVREMAARGITFGAHTINHPILSRLPKDQQEKEIAESIERIKAEIGECRHFAYPNGQLGDWNAETVEILRSQGIMTAWTTEMRRVNPLRDESFALPRIAMDNSWKNRRFEALASNALPFIKHILKM
jgi:peptidoglycan/xylan/chitin deacetylase (PgdA/CDA1 family)